MVNDAKCLSKLLKKAIQPTTEELLQKARQEGRVEGAKQELEIIRGFILFEKEKANWEDFYKFVEKRLKELEEGVEK